MVNEIQQDDSIEGKIWLGPQSYTFAYSGKRVHGRNNSVEDSSSTVVDREGSRGGSRCVHNE